MRIFIVILLLAGSGANALSFNNYETNPIAEESVELKNLYGLVPVEVLIHDTEWGYLIGCALFDAKGGYLAYEAKLAQNRETRFFFERSELNGKPETVECIRSQYLGDDRHK